MNESPEWEENITLIEKDDDVLAGPDGIWTKPIRELANRTLWLKKQSDALAEGLDEINGEVIEPDIKAKLDKLAETKQAIIDVLRALGLDVPDDVKLGDLVDLVTGLQTGGGGGGDNGGGDNGGGGVQGEGKDITNVVNANWFNPGTRLGGISWNDPTAAAYDYIEVYDLLSGEIKAQVAPGVQRWDPEEGAFKFRLRVKLSDGNFTVGVTLPETTYAVVYRANLQSATIPMALANMIVLSFDNYVKITSAAGFSVSGISDSLVFVDQPNSKTIRLRLQSKYFSQNGIYTLGYDPLAGDTLLNNDAQIDAIVGRSIENYSSYLPSEFVSAQIPQEQPATLVVVMSRPIQISNAGKFALSGTSAAIVKKVTDGATIEFELDEPVDSSETEPTIKLTYIGGGAADDAGQPVAAFSNVAVTNNSTNVAITVQSAEVPSSDASKLYVVMQGAVSMASAAGFSISSADQADLPDLAATPYTISDGTIIFNMSPAKILAGKTITVAYNGNGSLKKTGNNDKVRAFSLSVTNNSTDMGGIPLPQGGSARDLGFLVLGKTIQNAAEMREVCEKVHYTIQNGQVGNFVNGDYWWPDLSANYKFTVAAGYDANGGLDFSANADLGTHGKHIAFMIVSKNGLKGKNGNNFDHVVVHMMNSPGYSTDQTNAEGHYMETTNINTNGYKGCKGRQYLLNNFLAGLKNLGIPLDETWMKAPARKVSKGGSATSPGFDLIEDKLFLPTEYEMHGAHTYSNSTAEAAADQGRWEYYDSNTKRIKYRKDNTAVWYWCASPYSGSVGYFCCVDGTGAASTNYSNANGGFAPAFCVG
jgi:hypothetical protein